MNTPTLDRMLEIQEQSELCGEFLDWFLHKYAVFERRQKRESHLNRKNITNFLEQQLKLRRCLAILTD